MKMPIAEYAMLLLACVACTGPDRGCPLNYSKGDQFKITVNGNQPGYGSCSLMPLNPGVNFVVTASGQMTNQGCYSLAAEGTQKATTDAECALSVSLSNRSPVVVTR